MTVYEVTFRFETGLALPGARYLVEDVALVQEIVDIDIIEE